jgi:uncharacterized membrane protein YfcA
LDIPVFSHMQYLIVLIVGVVAGTVSGIVGTGSSMILMPVLILCFGAKSAVPIMALGAIMGNLGKVLAWRKEVNWPACAAYCSTAVPGAAIGVRTLLALPPHAVEFALGVFFIAMIPARRALARLAWRPSLGALALLGGVIGFLTGIVVSTGPLTVPLFAAYGLERGPFLATDAASSLAVYGTKVATFQGLGALPMNLIISGLVAGSALMAGSFCGRYVVLRMTPGSFTRVLDGLMLASGAALLWAATQ